MIFSFLRRRKKPQVNVVELENVALHKSESLYYNHYNQFTKKDYYCIHTIVKKVPLEISGNGFLARIRYVGIPNMVVYFTLRITNIQRDYMSGDGNIDVHVNAVLSGGKCKEYKFQLLPVIYQGGALACI